MKGSELFIEGHAEFDATGQYRFTLSRSWDKDKPKVGFVMLNPSSADATRNDPTIRRCIGFARDWGFGSVEIVNLFAYRTPYPQHLQQITDPIGCDNDTYLVQASQRSRLLVLAWGNWGTLLNRGQAVANLLANSYCRCFGFTRSGQPLHPLYLPKGARLEKIRIESDRILQLC
jgi:hypothetical protein